ncbi:MAG: NADH-quinone oxidoreductase subunit NuoG [Gammaproteobacteria bacterium]|nr:NADH-quinone oxidoreductase subunit NuoG [Gammaproteobacteria bacterium]
MSDQKFKLRIDGVEYEASPGQMLIEITDAAGIYVPRFCYHEKLSVAANCRMCLVEVEKAPKPLPACATPVADGMVVSTRSPDAIAAQKATMEFLLINHPLDCPICDQGGECELQDLAMGYGRDVSRFTERKRSVADKDLGPLVSTDMTRCIHCTRCVRFGQEIAGIQELGTLGRGERTEIGTYIERSVDHELSGNIIDLCPVGALNNKPYRFSARAWEMVARPTIAPHDCVGANIYAHVLGGRIKRVVPRQNEAVNETWAADRDRFSYEGIYADDRVQQPLLRVNGELQPVSWEQALDAAAGALRDAGSECGALLSPSCTVEEGYLSNRILAALGSGNIDHRLRRRDFRDADADPVMPWLGTNIAGVEQMDALLVVGSNLRREAPLLAHRVRQAALAGARIGFVNADAYEYLFPVTAQHVGTDLLAEMQSLVAASSGTGDDDRQHSVVALREGKNAFVWLGQIAARHPRFAELRRLAAELCRATGAQLGYVSEGANAAGLALAGALPHRDAAGQSAAVNGRDVSQMLRDPPATLLLLGVEPELDFAGDASGTVASAGKVVALTPYLAGALREHADIVLPIGTFAETSGTYVNAAAQWQSFAGAATPVGDSRPAWKVLRVLANLLEVSDSEYTTSEDVRDELRELVGDLQPDNSLNTDSKLAAASEVPGPEILDVPMYSIDALVRRAPALQQTREARAATGDDEADEAA